MTEKHVATTKDLAMVKRANHYETAFEAYLRDRKISYLAIDETRRSLCGKNSIKNLDFIVSGQDDGRSFLVDVKGRKFPTGRSQYWRNWTTRDEMHSLAHWERVFGERSHGLFVFAFGVVGDVAPLPLDQLFVHQGRVYGFVGVYLEHYAAWSRVLSEKWDTVTMPLEKFRALARPVDQLFLPGLLPDAPFKSVG